MNATHIDPKANSLVGGKWGKIGGPISKGSEEFKFWDRSIDGLGFLYDHLHGTDDVEKAKTIGVQKFLPHIGILLMRGYILGQEVFEIANSSYQKEDELRLELSRMK